jgi:PAS domain S-box-containing protein
MIDPKILIVEDSPIVAKDLQKRLFNFGYNSVDTVASGEEGVQKAIALSPDLVLMDTQGKNEMDGIEAGTMLHDRYGLAIIFLSASIERDTLQRASKAEPFGFVIKPLRDQDLRAAIEMALYRRNLERTYRENETWYSTTLRSIAEAVITVDASGSVRFMNTAAENLTGWKLNEVLEDDLQKVFRIKHKLTKSSSANPVEQILKNKVTAVLKNHVTLISRDGRDVPIEESASPIKDEHGNIIGAVVVFQDVTDRMRVQEALKTSQGYAQSIIESSMDMVIAVDLDRKIIEFNKAAEETFGYRMKEVLGKHINILYTNPEEGVNIYKTTMENGRCVQEVFNCRKNGESFPSLLSSSILKNAKGEMIGVMGVSRDITKKRRADQELRESEERYRSLVEFSPDPICVFVGGKFAYVNSAAIEIFGAESSDDLIGRTVIEMVHPDYRTGIRDQFRQMAYLEKRAPIVEEKFFRIDWTTFEAEVAAIPFLWQGNSAIQVVLRDVTERRKTEQIIRSSEMKYRSLFEHVMDGVYQTTPDGDILTANPALARMLGYETEIDLLLLNVEKELYIDSEERRQYLKLLINGERIKNAEFRLRRKDNQIITVLENARVVRNKLGDILYFEGTITDITELKLAQEALQISEERFRVFIEQSTEAIWCFESPEPMSIQLSEERQIKYLMETNCLKECNNMMAQMCGFENVKQILGIKLKDVLDPTDPKNIEYLRSFIRSNYRLINMESHEVDKNGRPKYLLINMIGTVRRDRLIRVWGTQRDITIEKQAGHRKMASEESPIGQFIADIDGSLIDCNPALLRLLGYTSMKESVKTKINVLGHTKKSQSDLLKQLHKTPDMYGYELKISHAGRRPLGVVGNFVGVQNKAGEIICIQGTLVPKGSKKRKKKKY